MQANNYEELKDTKKVRKAKEDSNSLANVSERLGRNTHENIYNQDKFDVVSEHKQSQNKVSVISFLEKKDNGMIATFYSFQKLLPYRFSKIIRIEM